MTRPKNKEASRHVGVLVILKIFKVTFLLISPTLNAVCMTGRLHECLKKQRTNDTRSEETLKSHIEPQF